MSTKRITLNVAATFTQTFVSVVIGLFCSRWVYLALGETQFGLFSVVGSLIAFVAVFNQTLVESSGRFFAFALGQQSQADADKELVCKWFNTALSVQIILPLVLILVGAPVGVYAIRNVLTIPADLRQPSIVIFGFSLLALFAQMVFSPLQALYYAKQFIFVRNFFGIVSALLFAAEGWWLLHYDGNRLIAHAAVTTVMVLLMNTLLGTFAVWQFPEARIRPRYWFNGKRIKEMFSFSSFLLIGTLGGLFSNSGVALVLNKFFGPAANAALGIGTQVFNKATVVAHAVNQAAAPELTTRVGANRFNHAKRMGVRICLYSTSLALLIAAPFAVFADSVLTLWLKEPPQYATQISVIMMMNLLAERFTSGYMMLVHASGRIKLYTTCLGIGNGARCLLVLLLLLKGVPLIPTLWLGWFLPFLILNQMRVWFARQAIGVSLREYFRIVFVPLVLIGAGSFAFCFGFKALAGDAIWAVLTGSAANAGVVATLLWLLMGTAGRQVLRAKLAAAWSRFVAGNSPETPNEPTSRLPCLSD